MNEEYEVMDVVEEMGTECTPEVIEANNGTNNTTKLIIGLAGAVIVGATGLIVANRKKIKNWSNNRKAKKLENDGYTVIEPIMSTEEVDKMNEEIK